MASWREGDKTRNVHLGSTRKMDAEAARRKARAMKAEALGIKLKNRPQKRFKKEKEVRAVPYSQAAS